MGTTHPGTLHVDDRVLPGVPAALARLLQDGRCGVRFVTNTTKKSRSDLISELHAIGLSAIDPSHVLASGGIARSLLERRQLRPLLLVDPSLQAEFDGLDQSEPNAVVIGLAPMHFHYEKLNEAFRILLNGGSLIALHEGRYFAVKDGLNLGPGAFVKALEYAAGVQATVIGKPSVSFFQQALDDLGVAPEDAVMIGDDIRQDVNGAQAAGMHGILVRTGKYREGDEHATGEATRGSATRANERGACVRKRQLSRGADEKEQHKRRHADDTHIRMMRAEGTALSVFDEDDEKTMEPSELLAESAQAAAGFASGAMALLNEELRQEIAPKKLLRQFSLNIPPYGTSVELRSARGAVPQGSPTGLGEAFDRLEIKQPRWRVRGSSDSLADLEKAVDDSAVLAPTMSFTLIKSLTAEANDDTASTVSSSRSDTFEAKFGEGFLGIEFVINETRGQVMVKSVQAGSWSRNIMQIPLGVSITRGLIVDAINGRETGDLRPEDVLDRLQYTQRPMVVRFRRLEATMVVCKLCECKVDAWSLDEHTNFCVMSKRFELEADQINNALTKLATSIKTNLQSEALRVYFHQETLHFYNAIRVISIQAAAADVSSVESFALCSRLIKILDRIRQHEPESVNFVIERGLKYCSQIRNLIHAKMSKMRQTHKAILQLGPNDGRAPFQRTKSLEERENAAAKPSAPSVRKSSAYRVSIRDFQIIKPISKGAFGKVYLARKRTTGDQYAIKVLAKEHVLRKKQIQHIETERDILVTVESPFVVKLFWTFQTKRNLFLVMEYLPGGDFMSLLECIVQLEEQVARVYIAEVALALKHLHEKGCVHRDLKPDNILISSSGHIKLTDFGLSEEGVSLSDSDSEVQEPMFAGDDKGGAQAEPQQMHSPEQQDVEDAFADFLDFSVVHPRPKKKKRAHSQTFGRCGTPDYLSPEIILGKQHGPPVDYWALGVILYEMLVGFPPFNDETVEAIFNNILERQILWPDGEKCLSHEAMDLINLLLEPDPVKRIGWDGLQKHPFFNGIDWDTLLNSTPPFVPTLEGPNDTSYFNNRNLTDIFIDDEEFEIDEQSMTSSMVEPTDAGAAEDLSISTGGEVERAEEPKGSQGRVGGITSVESFGTNGSNSARSSFKTEQEQSNTATIERENNLKFPSGMYNTHEESDMAEAFRSFSFTNMNALAAASRTEADMIADTQLSEVESESALSILI
ncbi:hypothetical protein Poli38472_009069 [Pythium oligandrum]|uniref:Phospholysine phosphohistidine inorganic pyrophosphate phosphatase n=1 Tax=Pythium oligandrum TaxID=41045 RepID=A0A8K1CM72_PYTOL|nr:hypothetical protein Poli38472_009069 [Pythium oligandrum]|eukprot:TMW64902.1 hypothetical protein Poli38472_009069 [Pythium oligandrum]